jgi:hypothetical protein
MHVIRAALDRLVRPAYCPTDDSARRSPSHRRRRDPSILVRADHLMACVGGGQNPDFGLEPPVRGAPAVGGRETAWTKTKGIRR